MRPKSATAAPASPELGSRIRERREALRIGQREAAERVGVDRRAYQGWEGGTSGITWANLDKLAEVLGSSADWLRLGDEGIAAAADERRRGPQPAITRLANDIREVRDALVHDPESGTPSFLVATLLDIQLRLERLERASASVQAADDTRVAIDATRAIKEVASASAGGAPRATTPAAPVRDEGDAKTEDAPVRPARKRRAQQ